MLSRPIPQTPFHRPDAAFQANSLAAVTIFKFAPALESVRLPLLAKLVVGFCVKK